MAQTRYVTVTGNSSNGGTSEVDSWPLEYAIETAATAGMTINVKAGDYGDINLNTAAAGTSGSPIIVRGYTTTPGDLDITDSYPTYTYSDFDSDGAVFPSNIYPLIETDRGADDDPDNTDDGLTIDQPYWEFHNLMFQYQDEGVKVESTGDNTVLNHILVNEVGNWDPTNDGWGEEFSGAEPTGNLSGYGIYVKSGADNVTAKALAVYNAGADGIWFRGLNLDADYIEAYMDKGGNATDYLINFYGASGTVDNMRAYRYKDRDDTDWDSDGDTELPHRSRVAIKCGTDGLTVNDFYIYGTRLMIYQDATDIEINDFTIDGEDEGETLQSVLIVADQANDVRLNRGFVYGQIEFSDYSESDCSNGYDNNSPTNVVVTNTVFKKRNAYWDAPIDISQRLQASASDPNTTLYPAGDSYFINCTFDDFENLIHPGRNWGEITLVNCALSDASSSSLTSSSRYATTGTGTTTASYVNYDNVNYTISGASNTSTNSSGFVDEANDDYSLTSESGLLDIGNNVYGTYSDALTSKNGVSHLEDGLPDIGSYEYESPSSSDNVIIARGGFIRINGNWARIKNE